MNKNMFCWQCQETALNSGCKVIGVCGKTAEVSNLQDLLIYVTKGYAQIIIKLRKEGYKISNEDNENIATNLFITITNANFSGEAIEEAIEKTIKRKEELKRFLKDKTLSDAGNYNKERKFYKEDNEKISVLEDLDEDKNSLKGLILYGLKGLAAYSNHARALKKTSEEIDIFIQETLKNLLEDLSLESLINLTLETGKFGVDGMAMLDEANTTAYGNPEITKVNLGVRNNPGILVSGHDLHDLEMLLEQSKDKGVDIYTHSEMLPAHYYPALKKYSHFIGNYGNSWWKQNEEFETFNGAILMTTNCIVPPKNNAKYQERMFTTGAAGFDGCIHIKTKEDGTKDFSQLIEVAKNCLPPKEIETGEIVGGFAHNQVISLADKIITGIKNGAIRKFVVMAGCDGRFKERDYYTEFAEKLPKDVIILTAGCAKYRYNKLNLGDIDGIPRVLDAGQCNDSYSLAIIALKLKEVFGLKDINELPIIYNIAWYEQKAIIVLLSLLYLGIKNIKIGPTIPGFLSPNITNLLIENFGLSKITTVDEDMNHFFNN